MAWLHAWLGCSLNLCALPSQFGIIEFPLKAFNLNRLIRLDTDIESINEFVFAILS